MKWLLVGATLGLLLAFPSLLALVVAVVAALLSKPVLVGFGLGLVAGIRSRRLRRWAP